MSLILQHSIQWHLHSTLSPNQNTEPPTTLSLTLHSPLLSLFRVQMFHQTMMLLQMPLTLFLLFLFLLPPPFSASASDLLRTSCSHARYPRLCLRTLSAYAGPANTPKDLAQAALTVSLDHTRRLSHYLNTHTPSLSLTSNSKRRHRQRSALRDCAEQIADSVEDLSRSLKELQHLRTPTFQWQMSNAQTWVSAALTNDDTCLDGLSLRHGDREGHGRSVVGKIKHKINRLARVTSNALYMINRLSETRKKGMVKVKP